MRHYKPDHLSDADRDENLYFTDKKPLVSTVHHTVPQRF